MTINEMIQKIRNADNWTDEFFSEIENLYFEHLNTVRNTLVSDGLWDRFDTAFCEWKKPGQAAAVSARKTVVCDKGAAKILREHKPIVAITAAELDKKDIPPVEWLVPELLPVGLAMLGAPSKYYKSYMALGLCIAICTGGKFLGYDCNRYDCLYLDLESTERRPKSRLNQILGKDSKKPDNLYIITGKDDPGRIGAGFEQQIESQMEQHQGIKLIVVDVFQMIRPPAKKNQSGYDRDYDDFKILKHIADKYSICMLLIHHTRKMKDPSDVFNELSGSVGVMGALDCAFVITKDSRYDAEGTLHITGRDMDSMQLKIKFDKKLFRWQCLGTAEDIENQRQFFEYDQSPITETIRKLVKQGNGHWEGSASDIKEASKYLSWEIYDDVRKIGTFINKHESFLMGVDGLEVMLKRTKNNNVYIFNSTDTTNSINSTNSNNSTQMELVEKVE